MLSRGHMPLDTCTSKFNKGQHQGTFFKHTAEFVMNNIIIIIIVSSIIIGADTFFAAESTNFVSIAR